MVQASLEASGSSSSEPLLAVWTARMAAIEAQLEARGVPTERIRTESFGLAAQNVGA